MASQKQIISFITSQITDETNAALEYRQLAEIVAEYLDKHGYDDACAQAIKSMVKAMAEDEARHKQFLQKILRIVQEVE